MQDGLNEHTNQINFQGLSQNTLFSSYCSFYYLYYQCTIHMCVVGVHDALHIWVCVNVYVSVYVYKYKFRKPHPPFNYEPVCL